LLAVPVCTSSGGQTRGGRGGNGKLGWVSRFSSVNGPFGGELAARRALLIIFLGGERGQQGGIQKAFHVSGLGFEGTLEVFPAASEQARGKPWRPAGGTLGGSGQKRDWAGGRFLAMFLNRRGRFARTPPGRKTVVFRRGGRLRASLCFWGMLWGPNPDGAERGPCDDHFPGGNLQPAGTRGHGCSAGGISGPGKPFFFFFFFFSFGGFVRRWAEPGPRWAIAFFRLSGSTGSVGPVLGEFGRGSDDFPVFLGGKRSRANMGVRAASGGPDTPRFGGGRKSSRFTVDEKGGAGPGAKDEIRGAIFPIVVGAPPPPRRELGDSIV